MNNLDNQLRFPLTEFNSNGVVIADIELNANTLRLRYSIAITPDLVWPEFSRLERKDQLWRSNSYSFSGYREGMKTAPNIELDEFQVDRPGLISASFLIGRLSGPFLFGPATILADKNGRLRYFAIKHGETPDFHNRKHHVLVATDEL